MSGRGRFNTRSNQGYNQNKSTYNTRNSYNSSPAYSTPTGGYQKDQQQQQHTPSHQQYHHEPQQQAPSQQQHVPPAQTQKPEPPAVQLTPPVTPKVQPPPVQVPAPQATPKPENNVQVENDVKMGEEDEAGKKLAGRGWLKRRVPGGPEFKVPRRIRKRRQNARLKSILAPKNAMMVLHELHPDLKQTVKEINNAANQPSYNCEIEIEGETFVGLGMSKMIAKQGASEAALKAVLLKKLEENNLKEANAPANKLEGGWEEDVHMADVSDTKSTTTTATPEGGEQNGSAVKSHVIPEDDVPWGSLASFALYKLFAEWQSQGFQLPPVSGLQGVPAPKVSAAPVATPMKKLPDDAHLKHPVQLLNQIRPGIQYLEHKREGLPPNLTFSFTIVVDDLTFKGTGTSKKEAKKLCAKHALEHLGVVYPDEQVA